MFFPNLAAFAVYLRSLTVAELLADVAGRAAVAKLFEREIKAKIGDPSKLQDLAPGTQESRSRAGYAPNEPLLMTGELRDSIGWEHASTRVTIVGSTDEKAVWHEFGTNHVPARSFLASTAAEKNAEAFALYSSIVGRFFGQGKATLTVEVDEI